MNDYIFNSFSLVGNIAKVNEIKEQQNGTKFRYFTIAQNNKYKNKDGEIIDNPSFINIKIFEKQFKDFEKYLTVGRFVFFVIKIIMRKFY